MSTKQATVTAVVLVAAVALFVVVYTTFSKRGGETGRVSSSQSNSSMKGTDAPLPKQVTPDAAVDQIQGETQTDATAFDAEESTELSDLNSMDSEVNDLNNVYDETDIQ